jgi:hypothetical protein
MFVNAQSFVGGFPYRLDLKVYGVRGSRFRVQRLKRTRRHTFKPVNPER